MSLPRSLKGLLCIAVAVTVTASLAFPISTSSVLAHANANANANAIANSGDDGEGREHSEESELHEHMEAIETQVRLLRRSLRKPEENAASLASLHIAEENALICKALIPHRAESEDDQDAFLAAYRADMCTMIQQLLECEKAVLAGDNEKAEALFKDAKRSEKEGHKKYQEEGEGEDDDHR